MMGTSKKEILGELIRDARTFRFCGPSDDPDEQTAVTSGWLCQFVEEDLKTPLPRSLTVAGEQKIWEMTKRGGFTLNIAGRRELEGTIRKGSGGIWLELTAEQYAKLRGLE